MDIFEQMFQTESYIEDLETELKDADKVIKNLINKLRIAVKALHYCDMIDKSDYDKYKVIKSALDKINESNKN